MYVFNVHKKLKSPDNQLITIPTHHPSNQLITLATNSSP